MQDSLRNHCTFPNEKFKNKSIDFFYKVLHNLFTHMCVREKEHMCIYIPQYACERVCVCTCVNVHASIPVREYVCAYHSEPVRVYV